MKTIVTYKMMRKCLILVFMIVGLFFVASSNKFTQQVGASECCENCTGYGDQNLVENYCTADFYACIFIYSSSYCSNEYDKCLDNANHCYTYCTYCFSNEPGNECNSNTDCNINEFCGADNHCHTW